MLENLQACFTSSHHYKSTMLLPVHNTSVHKLNKYRLLNLTRRLSNVTLASQKFALRFAMTDSIQARFGDLA